MELTSANAGRWSVWRRRWGSSEFLFTLV